VNPETALHVAQIVLALHMAIALFVIFGMVAIPIGALRHWPPVFGFGWRFAHLAVVLGIAVQKLLGQTCFLSVWEFNLLDRASQAHARVPLIHAWAIDIMHWNMPLWFFTVLYVAVLLYIVWLWRAVPPRLHYVRPT
jgi:Protein of Unknown function (DUF2784)